MSVEEQYQAELNQAEIDHHAPTAGAMTGHVVANLSVLINKLQQIKWYIKGPARLSLVPTLTTLMKQAVQQRDDLGRTLLAEGEVTPSTTAAFTAYAMLTEDGRTKYQPAERMIDLLVHDYDTENLFITRAIKLAEREDRPGLTARLMTLLMHNQETILELQAWGGHDARSGLDDEDDDD
ncbi:ferritin-like domain-containing protein [Furfurilactobacillus entadae]|uniref:ferritin-like domain-containing protein n=1 Tax=Furfurilactobacillus entadae TaxID=2922307 RepID=UPI0035E95216